VPKSIHRLTPRQVVTASKPGYYADGGNLWLQVSPTETKSWIFRYTLAGKAREMGLGALHTYGLAEARDRAKAARQQLDAGVDPIEARISQRAQIKAAAARVLTFDQCAEKYIAAHRASWRNAKHAAQWESTLKAYASEVFGTLPVQAVDTALVMKVLEPIWHEKAETASRLRGRIEAVLDWATVRGIRAGDNPARWRGHLESLLPSRAKLGKVAHHAALPYAEVGDFIATLRGQEGTAARALEFTVLTAARTGEVIGARWDEFDLEEKTWTIPADRMKMQREHRVPLSPRAVELVKGMQGGSPEFVFPGLKRGKALSNMAMLQLLVRMERADITVHGFRSSFRNWAAEQTNFPREVAEGALAHVNADRVEAAYMRSDLFDKRRALMNAWAKHCTTPKPKGAVVPMRKRGAA